MDLYSALSWSHLRYDTHSQGISQF